jgi:hypothetical protein
VTLIGSHLALMEVSFDADWVSLHTCAENAGYKQVPGGEAVGVHGLPRQGGAGRGRNSEKPVS